MRMEMRMAEELAKQSESCGDAASGCHFCETYAWTDATDEWGEFVDFDPANTVDRVSGGYWVHECGGVAFCNHRGRCKRVRFVAAEVG